MKSWKLILIALVLSSLILGSLAACGGEKATTVPTEAAQAPTKAPQPTVAPTDTPVPPTDTPLPPTDTPLPPTDTPLPPTDTPMPEAAEFDPASLMATADMSSYRATMSIIMKGTQAGEQIDNTIEFTIEQTTDPPAQHVVVTGLGGLGQEGMDSIELYQVGDTMYMNLGGSWLSVPATEGEGLEQGLMEPGSFLEDSCGWKKESNTEINGVKVYHWSANTEDIKNCMPAEEAAMVGELTNGGGDIYIAVDGNYLVQMDIFYEGKNLDFGLQGSEEKVDEGRIDIHYAVSDVNQPFTITVPEEALSGSTLPEDIPVPEDAQDTSSMFGMITFSSPSTPQEVADFYKAEMPKNGWTETSADDLGGMFMLEYSKDGRSASFMISTDQDKGMTSVLITVSEGQ
jgi:hypothetical protein